MKRYKREIYQDWKDGELDLDDYRDMRMEYEKQIEELEQIIIRLQAEINDTDDSFSAEEGRILSRFIKYRNITEVTREMLIELVEEIVIYEEEKIKIVFRFFDEFRHIEEMIRLKQDIEI